MAMGVLRSVATFLTSTKKLILGRTSSSAARLLQQSPRRPTPLTGKSFSRKIRLVPFLGRKRPATGASDDEAELERDEGVWRRSILMGEKCDPLNFSGVIYYDSNGKRLSEIPRSPLRYPAHGSPLHALSFSISSGEVIH